jgi:hypothetical protein
MMHTYEKSGKDEESIWTVGYWVNDAINPGRTSARTGSVWRALKDFHTEELAASYVNYLNGGTGDYSR